MPELAEWLSGGSPAQLFVHGHTHADRALVLARPQDIVCVPDEVDPSYLAYLADLGLGPRPGHVVAASRFGPPAPADRALWARLAGSADALRALADLLRRNGVTRLHPFATSGGEQSLAAALEVAADTEVRVAAADPETAAYARQKHHIRAKAMELGVPVADGEVVTLPKAGGRRRGDYDAVRAAVERHLRPTGRAIVRGAQGAAGESTFVVGGRGEDVDGLLRRLCQREDNRVYLVEVLLPAIVSPHVQLHVAPDGGPIVCVGVTDQRWERPFVHGGNIHPSAGRSVQEMLDWADRLARWLQGQGYAGLLGLDFVEYADPDTGAVRTILAELHPGMDDGHLPARDPAALERGAARVGPSGERGVRVGHPRDPADDVRAVSAGGGAVPVLAPHRARDGALPREPAGGGPLRHGDAGWLEGRGAARLRRAPDLVPARGALRLTLGVAGP